MKQNVLRRLGALVLALALAVPMAVTPAWAADASTELGSQTVIINNQTVTLKVTTTSPNLNHDGSGNVTGLLLTKGSTSGQADLTAGITGGSDLSVRWVSSNSAVSITCNPDDTPEECGVAFSGTQDTDATVTAYLTDEDGKDVEVNGAKVSVSVRVNAYVPRMELKLDDTLVNATPPVTTRLAVDKTAVLGVAVIRGNETIRSGVICTVSPAGILEEVEADRDEPNGLFTFKAVKAGTATITATSALGVSAQCIVVVPDPALVAVTGVSLNKHTLRLGQNQSETLTATVTPSNASDPTVTWESDKPNIASVDKNGKVTANAVGTATITVTSNYDYSKSDKCVVTVDPSLTSFDIKNTTGGKFNLNSSLSKPGEQQMIEAEPKPGNAYFTYDSVTWDSADHNVVTVSKDSRYSTGLSAILTVVGPGSTTVTIQSGAAKGTCTVEVPGLVLSSGVLTMTNGRLSMKEGESEQLTYTPYGRAADEAGTTRPNWWSSDSSIVDVDVNTGKITARKPGTVTITLTLGGYQATCTVTVAEDTSALVTVIDSVAAGSPVNLSTARARTEKGTYSSVTAALKALAQEKNGAALSYITNLSVPTSQGIIHNNHRSEADTGAGVGITEEYKPDGTGPDTISALSFVPRSNFSGTAEITYTGWSAGKSFAGVIRVTVSGLGENGNDVTYTANGSPVAFQADHFNTVSNAKNGHNLKYVTFTLPQASAGTLYYNYTSESHPGEKVLSTTQYFRTRTPSLDKVTFVPAQGYSGTVKINYRATDTSDNTYTGTVTINVTRQEQPSESGDIYYSAEQQSWVTFQPYDFINASQRAIGEALSYVRFTQPPSAQGTLFYNYRGFADNGGMVDPNASYYRSGSPALSGVSFVPTTTSPSQVEISYTGYGVRGATFSGTIYVSLYNATEPGGTRYSVRPGGSVYFSGTDFYNACKGVTGKTNLFYVQFTSLPAAGAGALRYTTRNGTSSYTVASGARFYYNSSSAANLISNVYFQANSSYNGTVHIPYKAFCTDNTSFDGEVVIYVTNSSTAVAPSTPSTGYSRYFSDMDNHSWAVESVDYLYQNGVVNGISATGFGPGQKVLRRDFVVMLCRAYNFTSSSTSSFSDVPANTYYSQAIAAAMERNVVSGSGRRFYPNNQLTRQDAMVMIYNALEAAGRGVGNVNTSVLAPFRDAGSISNYAREAMATLVKLGVVNGDNNSRLNPQSTITRAEAAALLYRVMTM